MDKAVKDTWGLAAPEWVLMQKKEHSPNREWETAPPPTKFRHIIVITPIALESAFNPCAGIRQEFTRCHYVNGAPNALD